MLGDGRQSLTSQLLHRYGNVKTLDKAQKTASKRKCDDGESISDASMCEMRDTLKCRHSKLALREGFDIKILDGQPVNRAVTRSTLVREVWRVQILGWSNRTQVANNSPPLRHFFERSCVS